jgi:hypothetical protein
MVKLYEACTVIRSKNAGCFWWTIDLFFSDAAIYERTRSAGVLEPAVIASRFKVGVDDVIGPLFFDSLNAAKITVRTGMASGDPGERDVYGAQQAAVLFDLEIPGPAQSRSTR